MTNVIMDTALALATVLGVTAAAGVIFKNKGAMAAPFVLAGCLLAHMFLGLGPGIRQMVEGMFGYFDYVIAAMCGMIFVTLLSENGTLDFLFARITGKKRKPVTQSFLLLLFVMLPGALTGTAVAATALVGGLVGKFLVGKGASKAKAAGFVAGGSLLGLLCPPLCLPAMIASSSYSTMGVFAVYVGWALALLVVTVPAFLVFGFSSAELGNFEPGKASSQTGGTYLCTIPLLVVLALICMGEFLPQFTPFIGYPPIFLLGTVLAVFMPGGGYKVSKLPQTMVNAVRVIAPAMAAVIVTGSALEIFMSAGASGTLALHLGRIDGRLAACGAMASILICGYVFGGQIAAILTVLGTFVSMSGFTGTGQGKMIGIAAVMAVVLAFPLNKGALTPLTESMGMTDGPSDTVKILKSSLIPIVCVLAAAAVTVIFSTEIGALQLPFAN